ncbi:hypothetical protein [Parasulfitobacter algicola]|uniref:YD repeat-containing protein n=1 Tax=Parasulfitobacter algicola TaxID=2614809 RepID=A0ABX2IT67_9RHOB|nr:hypothetical protein [Sulfitobacter algicola]NSX55520.1 hypothetical protein [Sulfitobacter algicola]
MRPSLSIDWDAYGYTYNAANRMDSFSINGVVQSEYVYNAAGQQVIRRLTQEGRTLHSAMIWTVSASRNMNTIRQPGQAPC